MQNTGLKILIIFTITFGAFGIIAWLIGSLFKIMHWPGASLMLIAGTGLLVVAVILLVVFAIIKINNKPEQ